MEEQIPWYRGGHTEHAALASCYSYYGSSEGCSAVPIYLASPPYARGCREVRLQNLERLASLLKLLRHDLVWNSAQSSLYIQSQMPILNNGALGERLKTRAMVRHLRANLAANTQAVAAANRTRVQFLDTNVVAAVANDMINMPEVAGVYYADVDDSTWSCLGMTVPVPKWAVAVAFWPVLHKHGHRDRYVDGLSSPGVFVVSTDGAVTSAIQTAHPHCYWSPPPNTVGKICAGRSNHFDNQLASLHTMRDWWVGTDLTPANTAWADHAFEFYWATDKADAFWGHQHPPQFIVAPHPGDGPLGFASTFALTPQVYTEITGKDSQTRLVRLVCGSCGCSLGYVGRPSVALALCSVCRTHVCHSCMRATHDHSAHTESEWYSNTTQAYYSRTSYAQCRWPNARARTSTCGKPSGYRTYSRNNTPSSLCAKHRKLLLLELPTSSTVAPGWVECNRGTGTSCGDPHNALGCNDTERAPVRWQNAEGQLRCNIHVPQVTSNIIHDAFLPPAVAQPTVPPTPIGQVQRGWVPQRELGYVCEYGGYPGPDNRCRTPAGPLTPATWFNEGRELGRPGGRGIDFACDAHVPRV